MNCLLSDEECVLILSKSFPNTQVNLVKFNIKKYSLRTLGYLGDHLLLNVFYRKKGESDVQKITYFVKCLPIENKEQKEFIESFGVIRKETVIYEKLISKLETLVSNQFCAKFYYGRDDIIVLENLQANGYKISTENYFGESKIKAVLRTMAMMHAACIKLESERCTMFGEYALVDECQEELTDNRHDFIEGNARNIWYKASAKCVAQLCQYFIGGADYTDKILTYLKDVMPKLDGRATNYRNVLCHYDLWINNIMFKDNNECLFVDFQLAIYGPPAIDIWLFLYFNVEFQFLQANLERFLNHYYTTLECELQNASIDIAHLLPKDVFLRSIEDYAMPSLFHVCACGTYIFTSHEFVEEMMQNKDLYEDFNFGDRSKYILEEMKKNKYYETKFKNIILPLCKMFEFSLN